MDFSKDRGSPSIQTGMEVEKFTSQLGNIPNWGWSTYVCKDHVHGQREHMCLIFVFNSLKFVLIVLNLGFLLPSIKYLHMIKIDYFYWIFRPYPALLASFFWLWMGNGAYLIVFEGPWHSEVWINKNYNTYSICSGLICF